MNGDPNIHIARRAGIPMITNRVATNQQVVNLMIVQQL
jgi:hypothetical protein